MGLPDNCEFLQTVHKFSKIATPFHGLRKTHKSIADSQEIKDCGDLSNTKSDKSMLVSQDTAMISSGKCFCFNKSGHKFFLDSETMLSFSVRSLDTVSKSFQ